MPSVRSDDAPVRARREAQAAGQRVGSVCCGRARAKEEGGGSRRPEEGYDMGRADDWLRILESSRSCWFEWLRAVVSGSSD